MCLGELGRVTSVADAEARVELGPRIATASLLTMAGPVAPGDWVLVHAGFVLARLTPDDVAEAVRIRGVDGQERVERSPG